MASVAMIVGGALVNALVFSGSNYLFLYYIDLALTTSVSAMIKQSSSYRLFKQNGLKNALSASTGSMRNSATRTTHSKPFKTFTLQRMITSSHWQTP